LDVLAGVLKPEDLDDDEREQLQAMWEEVEETHPLAMEEYLAGQCYRQELARVALP
jgi:hypothetical protein